MNTMTHPGIIELTRRDRRYAYEAYEFMFDALSHAQKKQGRGSARAVAEGPSSEDHITCVDLLSGACELARSEFGWLARSVFHQWGILASEDVGEIIFNLIDARLLSRTENDHREDFRGCLDLDRALTENYTIPKGDLVSWAGRGMR